MNMKKKLLAVCLAATFPLALFTGCNGNTPTTASSTPTDTSTEQTSSSESASEPQTITLSHCQGEWMWPMLNEIFTDYKERSGNTVELLYVPADGYNTWITTQYAGGTEPDVIWATGQAAADAYKNGWIMDLKPYYEGKSPYTGNTWQDSFQDGVLKGVVDPSGTGAMLGMPTGCVTVNLYYNKDVWEKAGIDGSQPLSWTQVLDYCKQIKEKDPAMVPMSCQNSISWNLGWQTNFMMEQLWYDVVPTLDLDGDGILQQSEIAAGIKGGIMKLDDPRMTDFFKYMKELSSYFNTGFNSASWEYEGMFNEGKSSMQLNGSWYPNQVLQNDIKVNYGILPIPYVDKGVSAKAEDRVRKYALGLGGIDMTVSKKAFDEGRGEAAVNLLQYLSDPKTGAQMMTEKTMSIPMVKDVQVPDVMKGITDYIGTDIQSVGWNANVLGLTTEANDKYNVLFANFLDDAKFTPEQMTAEFAKLYTSACDEAITSHPEWDVDALVSKLKP